MHKKSGNVSTKVTKKLSDDGIIKAANLSSMNAVASAYKD